MKIGIYIWRHKDENRYCIGEWNPSKKQYENLSDLDGAKFRIEQEIKSKDGTSKYAMSDIVIEFAKILDFYNPDNRQKGFDKLIHQNLKNYFGNSVQVATEFFELSPKWKNPASIFKDAVLKTASNNFANFNPERPFSYTPRVGSQDLAIDAIIKSAKSGNKKFLLGAKCRFGKTFSSYEAMVALKAKTTLIMTFRPTDTRDAWRSDLNSHQDFSDYHFYTVKEIEAFKKDNSKKVLFLSFQKITQALNRNNSELYEFLKKINFDMLIIDEDQIGAHRQENRLLVSKIAPKFTLVVTGTPELEIISNEFGDNFYKFDYIDEQKLKEKYHETSDETLKDYDDMPKLSIYAFDVSEKFADTIIDKNGFQLSEFFKVRDDGTFEKAAFIKKILRLSFTKLQRRVCFAEQERAAYHKERKLEKA